MQISRLKKLKKKTAALRVPLSARRHLFKFFAFTIVFFGAFGIVYIPMQNEPPKSFLLHSEIIIEEGQSTRAIIESLYQSGVIRSKAVFSLFYSLHFGDAFIQAGSYTFNTPLTSLEIAEAITKGLYMTPPIEITIPEGFRARDILAYLPSKYKNTDISNIEELEGRLFPDTYKIEKDTTFEEILELMQENFERKTSALLPQIESSGFTLDEVVTLASILEKEGNSEESMRTISGIVHSRLQNDMPLQVDATFYYTLQKTSAELTRADLRTDSPYNTYTRKGLPAGPIANPGLTSMKAVLNPIPTDYLFYLTGANGIFYYAETHDQHVSNKFRYLQ